MKVKSIILLTIVIGSLFSCGTTSKTALMKIEKNMSKREVTNLLGSPDYRRFDKDMEEWEYIKQDPLSTTKTIIIINFENDKVIFLNSFNGTEYTEPPMAVYPPNAGPGSIPIPPNARPGQAENRYEREFQQLYDKVKKTPFKEDQLEVLRMGSKNKRFTCEQCIRLMSIYPFDDDRLDVLKIVAPRIVDGENYVEIINSLSFLSSQDKARKLFKHEHKQ